MNKHRKLYIRSHSILKPLDEGKNLIRNVKKYILIIFQKVNDCNIFL